MFVGSLPLPVSSPCVCIQQPPKGGEGGGRVRASAAAGTNAEILHVLRSKLTF